MQRSNVGLQQIPLTQVLALICHLEALYALRVHCLERIGTSTLDDTDVAPRRIKDAGRIFKDAAGLHATAKRRIILLTVVAEKN